TVLAALSLDDALPIFVFPTRKRQTQSTGGLRRGQSPVPTDALLYEVEYRFEVVGGKPHGQVGHQALQDQFEISGEDVDAHVVPQIARVALPEQAFAGRGGELFGTFGPARAEIRIGAGAPGDLERSEERRAGR